MVRHVELIDALLESKDIKDLMLPIQNYDMKIYKHSVNVAYITALMLDYADVETTNKSTEIIKGALLHDIGKLTISKKIISSPEKLSDSDFEHIKQHSVSSGLYAKACGFSEIVYKICKMHHEKLDGTGYPDGISYIPFFVQIVTVADIFDALISVRPYKKTFTYKNAIKQLKKEMNDGKLNIEPIKLLEKASIEHKVMRPFSNGMLNASNG